MALLVLAFSGGKQSCSDSFSNSVPVYIPPKLPLEPSGCGCALTSSERKSEPLFGKLDCSLWGDFTACPVPLRSPSTFFFFFFFWKKILLVVVSDKPGFEASFFLLVGPDRGSVSKLGSPCFLSYIVIVNVWHLKKNENKKKWCH